MKYVVGFLFRPELDSVVTIRKTKPDWQRGKLNGVGGKVEFGEKPVEAMTREFYEETGAAVLEGRWSEFLVMDGPGWVVHCFCAVGAEEVETKTEEEVVEFNHVLGSVLGRCNVLPNLLWVIPMALDHLQNPKGPKTAEVTYTAHQE